MASIRKFFTASTSHVGPRTVRVIASTSAIDRMGEVVVASGIDLSSFLANPIILWAHDPEHPVGTATSIGIVGGALRAEIEFAPEGLSQKADEICALVKTGIIKTVSIGFNPVDMEPMERSSPRGPQRYTKIELMEVSFVSIPANQEAIVVERSPRLREGRVLSAENRTKIATAHEHANACMEALGDVLDLGNDGDGEAKRDADYRRRQAQLLDLKGREYAHEMKHIQSNAQGQSFNCPATREERLREVAALARPAPARW